MRGARPPWADERGIASFVALFIMAILLTVGTFLVRMSATEGDIVSNAVWSEGSFFAAEAGVSRGIDQVTPTVTTATIPSTALGGSSFSYQGNTEFVETTQQPGYSLGSGTGYNPGGFVFYSYDVSGTGTGPRSAQRQIEVRAAYGPVAK
jgi:hypothetical protein